MATRKIASYECVEVREMYEGMNYQKEKRKKRFTQKDRKKRAADHKYLKIKRPTKSFIDEEQYGDNRELINSR
jgi:hypothetical protein